MKYTIIAPLAVFCIHTNGSVSDDVDSILAWLDGMPSCAASNPYMQTYIIHRELESRDSQLWSLHVFENILAKWDGIVNVVDWADHVLFLGHGQWRKYVE